jgi:hypothetical protein
MQAQCRTRPGVSSNIWRNVAAQRAPVTGSAEDLPVVSPANPAFAVLFLGAHGVPAAIVLGLATGRAGRRLAVAQHV